MGMFIAFAGSNATGGYWTSSDASFSWTKRALPAPHNTDGRFMAMYRYSGGLLAAYTSSSGAGFATSRDGTTWTCQSSTGTWNDIVYAPTIGRYVAVGDAVTPYSAYGTTETSWTSGATSAVGNCVATNTLGTILVAGTRSASGMTGVRTSTDGVTWTTRTLPGALAADVPIVFWNGSAFVAIDGGSTGSIATSPDGITWSLAKNGFLGSGGTYNFQLSVHASRVMRWANKFYLLALDGGGSTFAYSSFDGINWAADGSALSTVDAGHVATNGVQMVATRSGGNGVQYRSFGSSGGWTTNTSGSESNAARRIIWFAGMGGDMSLQRLVLDAGQSTGGTGDYSLPALTMPGQPDPPRFWLRRSGVREVP